jgi:hypothetical protein
VVPAGGKTPVPGNRTPEEALMIIITEKKLDEKLERATQQQFDLLQEQIDSDSETAKMLTPKMEDVPQYQWLYDGPTEGGHSLFDGLRFIGLFENKYELFFSKAGSKFTGFLAYLDTGREISNIKMGSFFDDKKKSNPTLAIDLIRFVDQQITHRVKISWRADVDHEYANRQYVDLLNKRNFIWSREEDRRYKRYDWVYTVTGKRP